MRAWVATCSRAIAAWASDTGEMLTFFTTAKPFVGHNGVIQRNALQSWTLVHPDAEVILFGDDQGAAEVARELGLRHEPHTEKNGAGSNRMDYMFERAQAIARHDVLCYSNCDIIFLQDFATALQNVVSTHQEFLMVGRRWDTEVTEPCDFTDSNWQFSLRELALRTNKQRTPDWIDYFVFSRGVFTGLPPLVVGRVFWDNWTVWKALDLKKPVVDASPAVVAVHQNHDYRHHPQGKDGVWFGDEAGENYKLAGSWNHLRTIADATEVLRNGELRANRGRQLAAIQRYLRQAWRVAFFYVWRPVWFFLLGITRPLRTALGLRSENAPRARGKV